MANADRRYTYRLDLPEDRVRVVTPSTGRVVVADLSASGSGLIVSPDDLAGMSAEPATFDFGTGRSFSVRLDPVRISKAEGQLRVGARFQDLPVAGMRVLSEFLIREFLDETRALDRLLLDPRTLTSNSEALIRRHLRRCLVWERRPLRVYDQGVALPLNVVVERIVELQGRHYIHARARQAGLVEGTEYTFVVALSGSVSHFTARVEHRSGDKFFIRMPTELHQAGFRDSVRTPIGSEGAGSIECAHPRLPEIIARPLLDLSARGFAFESDPEHDLLFPGDRLVGFQLRFDDAVLEGSGVIRGVSPHRGSDRYSCGVEIAEFADAKQERAWRERVFRHVHPHAVVTEPRVAARQAWQVLDKSGYLRLWAPGENLDQLEAAYKRTWSVDNDGVGRLMLVESGGETVGTLAGSLLFPKTWLVHQLGVSERGRAGLTAFLSLAYELYSGLMFLFQQDPSAEYFVIYAERDRRWTRTLYQDFVTQCPDQAEFAYQENRVFRRDPSSTVSRIFSRDPNLVVTRADAEALEAISLALASSSNPVEVDALAFGREEIGLEQFAARCRTLGWERERTVFVARERGALAAAIVAEGGGEGVNIFGLMNSCFIVNLRPEPVRQALKAALLEEVSRHFADREKPVFLFFDDRDAELGTVELMGYDFVSEGMRFIASKRVVPAWLSYLENVLTLRNAAEGRSSG